MTERALNRELLVPGSEQRSARPVFQATGENLHLARAASAFAHGVAILELNQRFPPDADLDATWECGIDASRPVVVTNPESEAAA